MILSRHLGLDIWVLVVSNGRKGNIAKDLNVVYQGSGGRFICGMLSGPGVFFFFVGTSDSWSVFL